MLEIAFARDPQSNGRRGYRSIIEQEDEELRRAGIYPGHPSLHAPPMRSPREPGR
jgi:hypothetical protein